MQLAVLFRAFQKLLLVNSRFFKREKAWSPRLRVVAFALFEVRFETDKNKTAISVLTDCIAVPRLAATRELQEPQQVIARLSKFLCSLTPAPSRDLFALLAA